MVLGGTIVAAFVQRQYYQSAPVRPTSRTGP